MLARSVTKWDQACKNVEDGAMDMTCLAETAYAI